MGYVENNLTTGETVLYRTGLHWIVLLVLGLFGALVLLLQRGGIALGILFRNATEMVTNKRVIVKVGLMRKKTVELFLSKVESIGVEQGILGRMLGYGSIVVRGTGGTAEPFKMVRSPFGISTTGTE